MAEQEEPMQIGTALDGIRDDLGNKFGQVANNMEKQLAELRAELEREQALTADLRRQLQNAQAQCDEFKQECTERTNDLNQINALYQSNADSSGFSKLVEEVSQRHQAFVDSLKGTNYTGNVGPMNQDWQDEIYKITQAVSGGASAGEQAAVIDELQQRTRELDTIKKIMNGEEPASIMEDLADQCEERHAGQSGDPMSSYKAPGKIEDPNALKDNEDWEKLLRDMVANPPTGGDDNMGTKNDLYMQELADRIQDLQQLKDIVNKKKDETIPDEDVEEQARTLLADVQDRHKNTEDQVASATNQNNADDQRKLQDYKNNDQDWRRELGNLVQHVLDKEADPEDQWWLDLEPRRKQHYDNIILEPQEREQLLKDAVYLNRELPDEKETDAVTELYIPIDPISRHRVIGTLYDAGMVSNFLNLVNPEMIDTRAVHRPENLEDPFPIEDKKVWENASLLLSSCKAMALRLPSYQPHSWCNAKQHGALLIAVLHALCKERLKNYVNIEKHPEIIRLLNAQELNADPETIRNTLTADEVLKRWMNMSLGRDVSTDIGNMAVDLYNTLRKNDSGFGSSSPPLNNGVMNKAAAQKLLNHVENNMGIKHNLMVEDLLDNNRKLEELLAARVFDQNNGLQTLSDDEANKYKSFWTDDNPNDDAYLPWLNSQLPPHLRIGNLYRDLSDGIILAHILERSQPGCINWKKMRKQIRHKFDKVANCNYVYDVMKGKFPFTLVGIAGPDIVDGRQKYIHTILWQIMRYQATKKLSELSFGGKEVTDADILKWSKDTHMQLDNRRAATVSGFRDRSLTTCVFYLELMKVVSAPDDTIKDELIEYDLKPMQSQTDGADKEARMNNARYAISLIRMYGGDVFVLPEDLVIMEPKAVLSVFAALMTVDYERKTQPKNGNSYKPENMDDIAQSEAAIYGNSGFSG